MVISTLEPESTGLTTHGGANRRSDLRRWSGGSSSSTTVQSGVSSPTR